MSQGVKADRELTNRVAGLTVGLAVLLAGACGLVWGAREAAGALLGSAATLVNFIGLRWTAARALRGATAGTGSTASARALLLLGASGARLGLIGILIGMAAAGGWVGVGGLLVSLVLLPVTVVAMGLRAARPA